MRLLAEYDWPGNVRELANIVERLGILHAGSEVREAHVREVLAVSASGAEPARAPSVTPAGTEAQEPATEPATSTPRSPREAADAPRPTL